MHCILQHEFVHGDENYYCAHEIDTNKQQDDLAGGDLRRLLNSVLQARNAVRNTAQNHGYLGK
jgi:hypothetical protein